MSLNKTLKEKVDIIVEEYKKGSTLTKICESATSSQKSVKKVLASIGIDFNKEEKEKYNYRLEKAIQLYREGKAQIVIEKECNLTRKTIRELLKKQEDLEYRDKSKQWEIRYKTEINHNCFNTLTEESLYWIGLLYADGHIRKDKEYGIELTLHNDDYSHLVKYSKFLETNREIKQGNGNCSTLKVNSKQIHSKLQELGFTHNKSYTAIPHELLKDSRDFWRGVVDGDGGIYNYLDMNRKEVFLCGTLDSIFNFIFFCTNNLKIKAKYPSKCEGKNLYQIHYYGEDAKQVAELLYKDSNIHLERKYQKYLSFFEEN